MATRLDVDARRIAEAILAAAAAHRAKCRQSSYRGDRPACEAIADQAEAWVAGGLARLIERSENGDDAAHERAMDTSRRILEAVGGAWSDISKGAMVSDLVDAIKKDAGTALKLGGFTLAVAAVAAGAGYLALTSAPSRVASRVADRVRR